MTNLDSILKSRAITLPTKVHVAKAIVFPVVMYECESWTVNKASGGDGIPVELFQILSLQMVIAAMKLKDACSLEEKLLQT